MSNELIAQVWTVYPGGHTQLNVLTPSTHDAPFWHGSRLQSSLSEVRKTYNVKPNYFIVLCLPYVYGKDTF